MNRFPALQVTSLLATTLLFLSGCPEPVPLVDCLWQLPAPNQERVPSASGFTTRVIITGEFTADELPAVHFSSDLEAEGDTYPNGLIFESAIAIEEAGCSAGCPAGGRIEVPLTPLGHEACVISREFQLNFPPTISTVTYEPASPQVGDDVTFFWTA
ncbi:MAG: hypothetical protein VX498_12400, partial [Myxococcota bacterium]|nr:hypothetical protein [Myxococcota bacterium]